MHYVYNVKPRAWYDGPTGWLILPLQVLESLVGTSSVLTVPFPIQLPVYVLGTQ